MLSSRCKSVFYITFKYFQNNQNKEETVLYILKRGIYFLRNCRKSNC